MCPMGSVISNNCSQGQSRITTWCAHHFNKHVMMYCFALLVQLLTHNNDIGLIPTNFFLFLFVVALIDLVIRQCFIVLFHSIVTITITFTFLLFLTHIPIAIATAPLDFNL